MDPNLTISNTEQIRIVLIRKLTYAVTSNILAEVLILLLYIFLTNVDIFNPYQTYVSFLSVASSLSSWACIFLYFMTIFVLIITYGKNYVIHPAYSSTRLKKFLAMFSTQKAFHLFWHVVIGGVSVWLLIRLNEYNNNPCEGHQNCLVENNVLLLLFGLYTGFYYCLHIYISDKNIMFPVIQQKKYLQFKANLFYIFQVSRRLAFWPCLNFMIFHFIFGQYMSQYFAEFFEAHLEPGSNLNLYLHSYLYCIIIFFNLNLIGFFYELFLTESVEFPIATLTSDTLMLKDAVNSNVRLIRHLGCLDLFNLSGTSKNRREVLFTLSQPGGHPHNWNNLIQNLLELIRDYTELLNKSTNSILVPEPPKVNQIPEPLSPPQKKICYTNLRNMSIQNETFISSPNPRNVSNLQTPEDFLTSALKKFDTFIDTLKEKTGFNFIFRELPEVNIQKCLADGQVIIWIVQSFSSLITYSLKEDRYGVVQKDLPVIISTIVELKLAVEKLNRIPVLNRKGLGVDDFNCKMKTAMFNSIKRSLYGICNSFGPFLKDLNLKKEIRCQLIHFLNVKADFY